MKKLIQSVGGPLLVLVVFTVALWLLHNELRDYHLKDFLHSLKSIPTSDLLLAAGLTIAGYVVLIAYDWLAVVYLQRKLGLGSISLVSLLGYSIGNSFSSLLGGSTVRYRLYTAWGFSAVEVFKLVVFLSVTLWVGVLFLGGILFLINPLPIPERLHLPIATARPLGLLLTGLLIIYLALCAFRHRPIKVADWEFALPSARISLLQTLVASIDLLLAASVLYVLLPQSMEVSFWHFLAIYVLATVAAMVSHVPGGLGVLELVLLVLLSPDEPQHLIGALLAFRVIYFLLPLALGLLGFGLTELLTRGLVTKQTAAMLGRWTTIIGPRLLTLSVFAAGVVLLVSGATPSLEGRMAVLRRFLPLPVIEISHFAGSIIGVLLLILSRGLQRRIETAYYATVALLAGGIVVSLLKGFDYEEAIILSVMLAILLPARSQFYRHGALLTERFSARWVLAIGFVLAATYWLMMMAYKNVAYKDELWWQFAFDANAPRALRALVGVAVTVLFVGVIRLFRSKSRVPDLPTEEEMEIAKSIIAKSPNIDSNLARLGDKRFLFNDEKDAFIMFGVEGQSWIAMGDPVGPREAFRELAWRFRELCDAGGWWPIFYQVNEDQLPMYVEMGLSVIKIGEEGRVHLPDFDLHGHSKRNLRRAHKKIEELECEFSVVPQAEVPEILPELRAISDAWLSEKNVAEKGFSLGFFDDDYVSTCPVAILRHEDRIVAFANYWLSADKSEFTIDLMRYLPDAPHGVMDYLFVEILEWGRNEGYEWFSMGMAPLAGIEAEQNAPAWNQVASLAYKHGEHFYNFQGLRQYKSKFGPEWRPKYIATLGGWLLPLELSNLATLISGGVLGLVKKDN